jgi:hypothetical protein
MELNKKHYYFFCSFGIFYCTYHYCLAVGWTYRIVEMINSGYLKRCFSPLVNSLKTCNLSEYESYETIEKTSSGFLPNGENKKEREKKRCGGKLVGELSCEWDNRVRDAQLIDRQTNK